MQSNAVTKLGQTGSDLVATDNQLFQYARGYRRP